VARDGTESGYSLPKELPCNVSSSGVAVGTDPCEVTVAGHERDGDEEAAADEPDDYSRL
jgi:hypothetical protein